LEAAKTLLKAKDSEFQRANQLAQDTQRACEHIQEACDCAETEQLRLQAMLLETQNRLQVSQEQLAGAMGRVQEAERQLKDANGDVVSANEERERGMAAVGRDLRAMEKELNASKVWVFRCLGFRV
jgi:chromosome segregation ATPase